MQGQVGGGRYLFEVAQCFGKTLGAGNSFIWRKGLCVGGEAWEALPHQGPTRKPIVDNRSPRHKKPLPHVCVVHEAVVKAQ